MSFGALCYGIHLKIKEKAYGFSEKYFVMPYRKEKFKKIGKNVRIGKKCDFVYSNIEIGDDVYIGDNASFIASIATIHIGNHVLFGPNVTIRGGDHRIDLLGRYIISVKDNEKLPENDADVFIEDDVWIGCNVTILKGVTIGKGSVIGAGSVVAKDVLPYTIHIGTHPVLEKARFTKEEIAMHENMIEKMGGGY